MTAVELFADICAGVGAVCLFAAVVIVALAAGVWV